MITPQLYRRYLAAVVRFHVAAAESCGLGPTDYQASSLLDIEGPMTTGQLAERLGLSPSATTRAVDRLVTLGLAERVPDAADRRRVLVHHTGRIPDGLAELLGAVQRPIAELIDGLNHTERAALAAYFAAATDAFTRAAPQTDGA
ncbi:MarR family winged helix-turn-helix transcriptional regulator [Nocardia puris]|uniref:DNA-binding MarR family transcriptional regulator n=1 Tax=Nocardia puris TaxID=208602 RepID=A0A366DBQ8_9NOCA|nr:MarR family transcriptional regulator [Nocardia puris]RBO87463.1 DNA-binding MarR family transcriptional regulator [Nocardia puris]